MKNMALHKRNPGAGNATGASEIDQAAKLIFPEGTGHSPEEQRLLADLRAEHRLLRFALVKIEIVGIAVAKGIFDAETAAEIAGISFWPQSLVDAAVEWRAERDRREPLPSRLRRAA